jgi:hypothetical protein
VLQYWYFYYDDVYSYQYPPSNFIWQAHEGDWEVVNVVLSDDEQPLCSSDTASTVSGSAVTGLTRLGSTEPIQSSTWQWARMRTTSRREYIRSHWCAFRRRLAVLAQLMFPPPSDFAFSGKTTGPPAGEGPLTTIRRIEDDHPAWMSFPGCWGELKYFHGPGPIGTVPSRRRRKGLSSTPSGRTRSERSRPARRADAIAGPPLLRRARGSLR